MNFGVPDLFNAATGHISKIIRDAAGAGDGISAGTPKPARPDDLKLIDAELGLSEEHFSRPEGLFGFSTFEELETAIENCKEMILESEEKSDRRKKLVIKLVQLRLKLQEIKDGPPEEPAGIKIVMGHQFEQRTYERAEQYCEKCCGMIWGVLYGFYCCKKCHFKCHNKCLNLITRMCAYTKVQENNQYNLDLCPEKGLSVQGYRCAECHQRIFPHCDSIFGCIKGPGFELVPERCRIADLKKEQGHPRRCDYNGQYYCSFCHWNSQIVIPARVIHNWDFEPQKVCRASLQFLRLMSKKPVINLEKLNPMLFRFVEELGNVKKLREDIMVMKTYLLSCHASLEQRLLQHLKDRQHFVENSSTYSMQDLVDLHEGRLAEYLATVHDVFFTHITKECESCKGKGFLCKLCDSEGILYPFNSDVSICPKCSTVYHSSCSQRCEGYCPKCERKKSVSSSSSST